MELVESLRHHLRVSGRIDSHNLVRPLRTVFLIKFAENLAAIPFTVGKAVQDGQVLILRQGTQIL